MCWETGVNQHCLGQNSMYDCSTQSSPGRSVLWTLCSIRETAYLARPLWTEAPFSLQMITIRTNGKQHQWCYMTSFGSYFSILPIEILVKTHNKVALIESPLFVSGLTGPDFSFWFSWLSSFRVLWLWTDKPQPCQTQDFSFNVRGKKSL